MDGKTIIKILKKSGWHHFSTHDSHHKMKKLGFPSIIVPIHGHKDSKPGTYIISKKRAVLN